MELTDIKGIGPKRLGALDSLGIRCAEDLLRFPPCAYQDFSDIKSVLSLKHGECAALRLTITAKPKLSFPRKSLSIVSCPATDGEKKITVVWFNQPYMAARYCEGQTIFAYGRIDMAKGARMLSPSAYPQNPGIVPLYRTKGAIPQQLMRGFIKDAVAKLCGVITETLPEAVLAAHSLMPIGAALAALHFPSSATALKEAQRRLAFEEMLQYRIILNMLRLRRRKKEAVAFDTSGVYERFISLLPFELTDGQKRVISEIESDLSAPVPMNRLVQGDVGSGKTVLSVYAMMTACQNGFQSALLAPTEILAKQHYDTLTGILGDSSVCLLTGAAGAKERAAIYERIREGSVDYIVGTHALLQSPVEFQRLGLIVCDEQQRFGVRQRAELEAKGADINVLVMSATPIPRTLALTVFGDLDVSQLKEMPKGRKKVKTRIVPQSKRYDMYDYLAGEAEQGRQSYVVCPMIESGEETMLESATEVYAELSARLGVKMGLLHGRMKPQDKERIISEFRQGGIGILVSTTVIEVGVDVPTAASMVIENAERFGLAQLHQLRGRVGRGEIPGSCFLLASNDAENERLKVLTNTYDGFAIAEQDLRLRGPGRLLGTEQHGPSETGMMLLAVDMDILTAASDMADAIFNANTPFIGAETIINAALARYRADLSGLTLN